MMKLLFAILPILVYSSSAQLSSKAIVELEKHLIILVDAFKVNFWMMSEKNTCESYTGLANTLTNLTEDLDIKFMSQKRQLEALSDIFGSPNDAGCLDQLKTHINVSVTKVNKQYQQCISSVPRDQQYAESIFSQDWTKYNNTRDSALKLMDDCLSRFRFATMATDLRNCVEKCKVNLNIIKERTIDKYYYSTCMIHFEKHFLTCINNAERSIQAYIIDFNSLLIKCRKVSDSFYGDGRSFLRPMVRDMDVAKYTLTQQVQGSQYQYNRLLRDVMSTLDHFLGLDMLVSEIINGQNGKQDKNYDIVAIFKPIFTVLQQSIDEQASETGCGTQAMDQTNKIMESIKEDFKACDDDIINNLNIAISTAKNIISGTLTDLTVGGNARILKCFAAGNIWTTNTIKDCFDISFQKMEVVWNAAKESVVKEIVFLQDRLNWLKNPRKPLECRKIMLMDFKVKLEEVFYHFNRCMYKETGQNIPLVPMFDFES